MKLIFAGTPEFAASALQALIDAGHDIALVLTQPDRPAGRGMKLKASPVKTLALAHGLPVSQPLTLKTAEAQAEIAAVGAEVMVVAAYGLILPKAVLEMPTRGCLNIHASLLPRWRGAAPIHRAIEAGDAETGVTIMQMDVGLDTGDMLLTVREPIHADDSTGSLHDRLAAQGAQAMVAALAQLDALSPQPQPAEGVTYAEKIGKAEAQLDWSLPAEVLHRKIRAFNPFPGASTLAGGEALKIWQAQLADGAGAPGEVLAADADGVRIACGSGALLATQLQAAGGKRLAAREFLAGHSLPARLGE
ncbi:methionyl-tRNA formyltransferase [Rivihabitans pingtungensis]|jgi:methionyl-tRNA formyltransferase|uniref:Methionyl-tRNA formyltransferase n=1 Tax=Rivihabitans pingtungensis TaxID=1054498 RepID=A0A318KIV7_9NEIS|nr:methionyl-tRNA formyltransferase [Rivihabitans pingtungensis]PXX78054.1 methionyl-tRNA formyltransferase [Rivihabitans pingtungensis]HNX71341.1 methionyl-tRNA formyltransferase [Rivihabitans pingtungensis]